MRRLVFSLLLPFAALPCTTASPLVPQQLGELPQASVLTNVSEASPARSLDDQLDAEPHEPQRMVPIARGRDGSLRRSDSWAEMGDLRHQGDQLGGRNRQGYGTAGSVCPAEQFTEALHKVAQLIPGVIDRMGGADRVTRYYLEHQASNLCVAHPLGGQGQASHWPQTDGAFPRRRLDDSGDVRGLLINMGAGEELGFLGCVADRLGLRRISRGDEGRARRRRVHSLCGLSPEVPEGEASCTRMWDEYDYVDDWPVEDQLLQLLATHPGERSRGVLLPVRDPGSWRDSRLDAHRDEGAADWTAPSPCSGKGPRLEEADAPIAKLSHDAWAACVARAQRRGEHFLFAFNLHANLPAGEFGSLLHEFLEATDGSGSHSLPSVVDATSSCRHALNAD